jgi:UDP-N-acetylglucosamine 2-epimerase
MAAVKVLYVVGARPNFVKMAPVTALRRRRPRWGHVLVHTGQHYDREMSEIVLEDLGVGDADHRLGVGVATPAVQTARIMERLAAVRRRRATLAHDRAPASAACEAPTDASAALKPAAHASNV